MKKSALLLAVALPVSSTFLSAQIISYSGAFAGADGASVTTVSDWSTGSPATDYVIDTSGSMGYTDSFGNELITSGNFIKDSSTGTSYGSATFSFDPQAAGTDFYVSFLYNSGGAGSPSVTLNPSSGSGSDIIAIVDDGGDFRFRTYGAGVGQSSVTTNVSRNANNLVVFKVDSTFGSGGTLHKIEFWLNPSDLTNIGSPTGTLENLASLSPKLQGYDSISFISGGTNVTGSMFDELRIGETMADVLPYTPAVTTPVPEPSTYALIASMLALGMVIYRRRKS